MIPFYLLNSVSIKNNPIRTEYYVGDTLDTTGMVLTTTYEDGFTHDVMGGFTSCAYNIKRIRNTRKSYTNDYRKFIVFCREKYKCKTKDECKEHIQDYADFLIEKKYKASMIRTYLASDCVYHNVHLKDIEKPKRMTSEYTRGRKDNNKKKRADNNLKNPKYERTVEFQSVVGIRRNELRKLKGEDLVIDESCKCSYLGK